MNVRVPDEVFTRLNNLANLTDRSKSYIPKKALEQFLDEYADYKIALDRLNDGNDKIISSKDMRKLLYG